LCVYAPYNETHLVVNVDLSDMSVRVKEHARRAMVEGHNQ
jgi:hypothetical protein